MLQPKLLEDVLIVLKENNIDYMVTGSIVSSIQGEPRATHDVDIVINIRESYIPALINAFVPPDYYLSEEAIRDAIRHRSMFNLIDTKDGDKVDFWILTNDPFDLSRFQRKYEEQLAGFSMKICSPEDTILMKLRWASLSGGSEKQFTDALRVYEVQYQKLDMLYLEKWSFLLNINELWSKLKNEAEPV